MAKYKVTAPTKAKGIAQRAGTTAAEIRRLNDLTKGQKIDAGTVIRLGKGVQMPKSEEAKEPEMRVPNLDPSRALNDPIYQYYMNEAMGGARGQRVQERERLSNLYTNIYGETGQLKNLTYRQLRTKEG